MRVALVFLLFLLPVAIVSGGRAQTTTSGALDGVVTDPSDAVVQDALVDITSEAKGIDRSTKTDGEGVYRFFFLLPGTYAVTVTHTGFEKQKRVVNVLLGPPVSLNVALPIAKEKTAITVTGEAPLVHAENGDASTTINQRQISESPNPGNDLTYIVQTAPGVLMNTDVQGGANFSILGMPGFSYLHTMDGMNDNDNEINLSQVGALLLLLGQNQVQEATVVSTGYSGQFGGAAGGNVNYITKSGSNQFHGNAQYYWNGRVLDANSWFNKAFPEAKPRPFSIANQWAGSLGGPIKKDKVFFFFDTEGLRLLIPQQDFVVIPSLEFEAATIGNIDSRFGPLSASDAFYKKIFNLYNNAPGASSASSGGLSIDDPLGCTGFVDPNFSQGVGTNLPCARHFITNRGRPSQDTLTSGRVDWNVTTNDRVFLRAQYDHGRGAIVTDPISSVFDADLNQPWWQAQLLETHTMGARGASQFLFAGSYFAPIYRVNKSSAAVKAFPATLSFQSGTFNSLAGADSFLGYGSGRYNTQYQISEDLVRIWGKHKVGLGGGFVRIYWSELPGKSSTIGQLNANTLRAFYEGGVNPAAPDTDFTSLSQSFTSLNNLRISFLNLSAYGQDEWRPRPDLTVTLALRAEHYANPTCASHCFARLASPFESLSHDPSEPYNKAILINQKQGFEGIDTILWSPRVSFAWQPLGISRNTVLRGGLGVFYDPLPGRLLNSFSGNPPLVNSYFLFGNNLAPDENTSLFKDAAASNKAFVSGFSAGHTVDQIRAEDPHFTPPSFGVPERRTHSPQYQRWSLEWQQGFGSGTSISLGYYGHHGIHELTQNPNANAFGFGSLPTGLCSTPPVPPCADPRFSGVLEFTTNAVSNYHGTVASFQHRFSHLGNGLFQANYTYGHALDENSSSGIFIFTAASLTAPQDPNNLRGSYGSADHDVRHSFSANYVWDVPVKAVLGGHGWSSLVDGWQVSGTLFARTGYPYTVFDLQESGSLTRNNYFGLLYAMPVGPLGPGSSCGKGAAVPLAPHPCQPPQVLSDGTSPNPNARFLQSGCITGFNMGNLGASGICDGPAVSFAQGRNEFRGPSYFNTDFAIVKMTRLPGWEKATLGIGFQFFNLFNHPNFGFPDAGISSPTFGQIGSLEQPPTSILGSEFGGNASPRMIQLKVQLEF
jgi:hypothetical protein